MALAILGTAGGGERLTNMLLRGHGDLEDSHTETWPYSRRDFAGRVGHQIVEH